MISNPPAVAAVSRRRLPGPVRVVLIAWTSLAVLGGLLGLALAVISLLTGTPGTSALQRTGFGVFSGALWGSILAVALVAQYYATWALLWLGGRMLDAVRGVKPAPGSSTATVSGRPASSYVMPGCAGTFVGLVLGLIGGGGLGFVAVLVWIITDSTDPMTAGLAPGMGVIFGILWGLLAGALIGSLVAAAVGFVAGFRIADYRSTPLPAT